MTGTAALTAVRARKSKYGNVRCELDGFTFDSKAEMRHYWELSLRQMAGEIVDLVVHPKFSLDVNGIHVASYIADFSYKDAGTRKAHVIDVKGGPTNTPLSKLKHRMFRALYGIEVEIVQ